MESFLNDLREFIKEIAGLPPETLRTYYRIMSSPFGHFTNPELGWASEYFGAGLSLMAFVFCWATPRKEFSGNPVAKWLMRIPMSKLAGFISKSMVLYLSALAAVFCVLCFPLFSLLPGPNSFTLHLKVLVYSFGTVYLTVSFCLMIEHLVMKATGLKSILEIWKETMKNAEWVHKRLRRPGARTERDNAGAQEDGAKIAEDKVRKAGETWLDVSRRYADDGVKVTESFWEEISRFQYRVVGFLMAYSIVYPLFCLSVLHF